MLNARDGHAEVDNGVLRYETTGSGPAVILIHGFGVDRRVWRDQLAFLSTWNTVVTYDLRGFGESSLPNGPYEPHEDLATLLNHLEIQEASIIGSSMGLRIALDFAISHPQRTRCLVSVDGLPSGWTFNRTSSNRRGPDPAQFARTLRSLDLDKQSWLKGIVADYSRWHRRNIDPRKELDPPAISRLGEMVSPAMVIVGMDDEPRYHEAADRFLAEFRDVEKHVIANVGHLPNLEAPGEFNQIVDSFLKRIHQSTS